MASRLVVSSVTTRRLRFGFAGAGSPGGTLATGADTALAACAGASAVEPQPAAIPSRTGIARRRPLGIGGRRGKIGATRPLVRPGFTDRVAEDMRLASSSRIAVVAVAWSLGAAQANQASPELLRVGAEPSALLALPKAEGSPALGELLPGTALRVTERRDGFARVVVEGWLPESALAAMPEAAPLEPEPPPAPQPPPEPVHDLALAHHVGVTAEVRDARDGGRELAVTLELRTARNQPVVVEGTGHDGRVRVYKQLKVAGGRARGPELVVREVRFEDGKATIAFALSELGEEPPRVALVSASAALTPQRTIYGAATD